MPLGIKRLQSIGTLSIAAALTSREAKLWPALAMF